MTELDFQEAKRQFLALMPPDGSSIGNKSLRERLGWGEEQYHRIKDELVREENVQPGAGRGGSVRRVDLQRLRQQFLDAVPAGGSVGNMSLQQKLGWDKEQYQRIRDELIAEGTLQPGRGYGGSLRRIEDAQGATAATLADVLSPASSGAPGYQKRELDLYPGFLKGLQRWAKDQGWLDHIVQETASQGRRSTGGSWTRPDFVAIGYRKFEYTPGVVRDVETFEVKPLGYGIEAVFETAAHSRAATKSYLAVERTSDEPSEDLSRIESECQRFEVGLITFNDPTDFDSWRYLVEPTRKEPDPSSLEKFIRDQVRSESQERIRKWLR